MTSINRAVRKAGDVPRIWNLITNHQNMLYMLAAGLVSGPDEFGGKHYADVLDLDPGWIPLCRDTTPLPTAALERAVSEQKFLVPCVASFDLRGFVGPVRIWPRRGKERRTTVLPLRKGKNDFIALMRAPLPVNLLRRITFRSQADQQAFETAAADVANVDLGGVVLEVDEARFASDNTVELPRPPHKPELPGFSEGEPSIDAQAIGGALAMLYHTANRSDFGAALYWFAVGLAGDEEPAGVANDPFFAGLPAWLACGTLPTSTDIPAQIYWRVVGALSDPRRSAGGKPPIDSVLDQLEREAQSISGEKPRARITRLASAMRRCLGLGGGTITELFKRHPGPLSRSLLLFCLREHCTDLLEFSHPVLSDAELAATAILFGVRDGWIRIPRELRSSELSAFVSSWMVAATHASRNGDVRFDTPDPPTPLRDLFVTADGQWTEQQENAALDLARREHWGDCIQTRVTLPPGDYPQAIQRDGLQLVIPGDATIRIEVDRPKFMERIEGSSRLEPPIANRLRAELAPPPVSP
ncbi:MAG: hypothetical protein J0H50_13795 [Xanthomonadales bacterium]|nr:hypothetical protein [Xanthomonadales bacterium]